MIGHRLSRSVLVVCFVISAAAHAKASRGLVAATDAKNKALVVGVGHGLPGIDTDVNNVNRMVSDEAFKFETTQLMNGEGTVSAIAENLTQLSADAADGGTFLFYFTGHGNKGLIYPQDRTMKIGEIRAALESGRKDAGPLARLVLMFDSCYSGSLLDPVRDFFNLELFQRDETRAFVEDVVTEMTKPSARGRADEYWQSLFVFAACRANETSLASGNGSVFTNAMIKAFDEAMSENTSLGEFVSKTQAYTKGHHPVARFAPEELTNEKMKP